MAALSDMIKKLPPWTVVLSFLAVVIGGAFSLGASSVTMLGYPKQTTENTVILAVHDTAIANIIVRQDTQHEEFQANFERVFCFLRLVASGDPIPLAPCEPSTSEGET